MFVKYVQIFWLSCCFVVQVLWLLQKIGMGNKRRRKDVSWAPSALFDFHRCQCQTKKDRMAQSMKRTETLGAMDHEPQKDKTRTSYFGNVKTRSGSWICGLLKGKQEEKAPLRHVTALASICISGLSSPQSSLSSFSFNVMQKQQAFSFRLQYEYE